MSCGTTVEIKYHGPDYWANDCTPAYWNKFTRERTERLCKSAKTPAQIVATTSADATDSVLNLKHLKLSAPARAFVKMYQSGSCSVRAQKLQPFDEYYQLIGLKAVSYLCGDVRHSFGATTLYDSGLVFHDRFGLSGVGSKLAQMLDECMELPERDHLAAVKSLDAALCADSPKIQSYCIDPLLADIAQDSQDFAGVGVGAGAGTTCARTHTHKLSTGEALSLVLYSVGEVLRAWQDHIQSRISDALFVHPNSDTLSAWLKLRPVTRCLRDVSAASGSNAYPLEAYLYMAMIHKDYDFLAFVDQLSLKSITYTKSRKFIAPIKLFTPIRVKPHGAVPGGCTGVYGVGYGF